MNGILIAPLLSLFLVASAAGPAGKHDVDPVTSGPNPVQAAAIDGIFLQLADVAGEASDPGHEEWMKVRSFEWGADRAAAALRLAERRRVPVQFSQLRILKPVDAGTARIMGLCAEGQPIAEGALEAVAATGGRTVYRLEIEGVTVVSAQVTGEGPDGALMEEISLAFQRIRWIYTELDSAGRPMGEVRGGWDVELDRVW